MIEKMRLTPNIQTLDDILAYILSQEADDVPRKSTQEKVRKWAYRTKEEEEEEKRPPPPRREYKCKICEKKHPRFGCSYKCGEKNAQKQRLLDQVFLEGPRVCPPCQ